MTHPEAALLAWTVPVEQRPACPLDGRPCRSWTCLVDVCVEPGEAAPSAYGTPEAQRVGAQVERDLLRDVLEAVCVRDGFSLESSVEPGEPARNYELALRLGIGQVFGLQAEASASPCPGCEGGWGFADNAHTRDNRCQYDTQPKASGTDSLCPSPACRHWMSNHNERGCHDCPCEQAGTSGTTDA